MIRDTRTGFLDRLIVIIGPGFPPAPPPHLRGITENIEYISAGPPHNIRFFMMSFGEGESALKPRSAIGNDRVIAQFGSACQFDVWRQIQQSKMPQLARVHKGGPTLRVACYKLHRFFYRSCLTDIKKPFICYVFCPAHQRIKIEYFIRKKCYRNIRLMKNE